MGSLRLRFILAPVFLQCLEHNRKVKELPPSKPEKEETIPTEKEEDAEQEVKPPSNSGKEKDLKSEKESVTGLESVFDLFSTKVR